MDGTPAQGYMRVITYSGLPGAVFGILRAGWRPRAIGVDRPRNLLRRCSMEIKDILAINQFSSRSAAHSVILKWPLNLCLLRVVLGKRSPLALPVLCICPTPSPWGWDLMVAACPLCVDGILCVVFYIKSARFGCLHTRRGTLGTAAAALIFPGLQLHECVVEG